VQDKPNCVLLVYGSGGHAAQMKRLVDGIKARKIDLSFVAIAETDRAIVDTVQQYSVPPLRSKYRRIFPHSARSWLTVIGLTALAVRRYRILSMISTGPGIAIPAALVCCALGKPVVHFETWSRFRTRSLAGKVLYRVASRFYVQNKEQLSLYPEASFNGRL
jgi:UDP-N-acetylglucosamine:LPS N-acetylglucosamine transferase